MQLLLTLLLFAGVAPESATGWMHPERLGVCMGMSREAVRAAVEKRGWKLEQGKVPEHAIVQLSERRSVTLAFANDALQSARFELIGFLPEIPPALREIEKTLTDTLGPPNLRIEKPASLVFEKVDPQVYVTAATDRQTQFGRQGLGFLVVRYLDPPPR